MEVNESENLRHEPGQGWGGGGIPFTVQQSWPRGTEGPAPASCPSCDSFTEFFRGTAIRAEMMGSRNNGYLDVEAHPLRQQGLCHLQSKAPGPRNQVPLGACMHALTSARWEMKSPHFSWAMVMAPTRPELKGGERLHVA